MKLRLAMIFTQEDMKRIQFKEKKDGTKIFADVHGMKCREAQKFIKNIINVIRNTFELIVIHGYNHGTAIRDMIRESFTNSHVTDIIPDAYNQGVTHLIVEAY